MRTRMTLFAAGLVTIAAMMIAAMSLLARPAPDYAYYGRPGFRIIAHRGGMGLGPENTIETFKRSLVAGADALDMDTRMTKDGQLVIMHDATVDRTTNGTGAVRDMNLIDVKKLDAGFRWSHGGRFSFRDQKITVPALTEVLESFPQVPLVIEIKEDRPAIGKVLCELLTQYRKTDSVLIASMHASVLSEVRQICPAVATSAGPRAVLVFYLLDKVGLTSLFASDMSAFQVPVAVKDRRIVTPEFVSAVHRRNMKVEVWTVNDVEEMQGLIEAGVDGIFTDFPERLNSVVNQSWAQ